ncbi:MAG: hypothetical protein COB38_08310 [Gammaproteobacteria bacterium]|nr:MAG: hypothetical protein COB38_08310 [Gammaproteobacteria bacterium]
MIEIIFTNTFNDLYYFIPLFAKRGFPHGTYFWRGDLFFARILIIETIYIIKKTNPPQSPFTKGEAILIPLIESLQARYVLAFRFIVEPAINKLQKQLN